MQPLDDQAALENLRRATWALAQDGEHQLAGLPDLADKPFELVDDFENWYRGTIWRTALGISPAQTEALRSVLDAIESIPSSSYTDAAVRDSTEWARLRESARAALVVFGWNAAPPDASGGVFVRAR